MKQWLKEHITLPIAGVIILVVILAIMSPGILRIALALLLVLFLPGFAVTTILFKRDVLGTPERFLLSVGLSVALTALIGLFLDWTPWGLTTNTLLVSLLLVLAVAVAGIVFAHRQGQMERVIQPINLNFTPRQWMLLGAAALVTFSAFYVSRTPVSQRGFDGYTTLWIQPSDTPGAIRLGVDSEEFEATTYQIRFEVNGTLRDGPTIELKPGETWEGVLQLPSDRPVDKPVKVLLYRLDRPTEIYRYVVWWPE